MKESVFIKERLDLGQVPFDKFVGFANDIQAKRKDYGIFDVANNVWMNDDGSISFKNSAGTVTEMKANSWALSQMSVKLGMPSQYAEKCITSNHADLAAENVNTWLTEQNGSQRRKTTDWLFRTYNGGIDAVLSSNYAAFDTPDILDVVDECINIDDYHIVGSYVSDERMHLRLIQDKLLSVPGEDLYPGIFIDSSDVGRTALNVSFGIWKKVCTNGLCIAKVGGTLYHQRHMGITSSEIRCELKANISSIPDLIKRSESIIIKAAAEKIDLNNEKVMEELVSSIRRHSLVSEESAQDIINLAKARYGATRWGVVNAMTEIAQKFELDDRIRIERAAGRIIAA